MDNLHSALKTILLEKRVIQVHIDDFSEDINRDNEGDLFDPGFGEDNEEEIGDLEDDQSEPMSVMTSREQSIIRAIEMEEDILSYRNPNQMPSQHTIQRNLFDEFDDATQSPREERIATEEGIEYFQLENIPSAQLEVQAGTSADAAQAETSETAAPTQRRKRRTAQEMIQYRLEQAELTATKSARMLEKARKTAEEKAKALEEK